MKLENTIVLYVKYMSIFNMMTQNSHTMEQLTTKQVNWLRSGCMICYLIKASTFLTQIKMRRLSPLMLKDNCCLFIRHCVVKLSACLFTCRENGLRESTEWKTFSMCMMETLISFCFYLDFSALTESYYSFEFLDYTVVLINNCHEELSHLQHYFEIFPVDPR